MLVIGAAAAAAYGLTRPTLPVTQEREGNDELHSANQIASGQVVTGFIGKRRSRSEGDRDVFQLQGAAREHVITAEVSGLPNVNVALSLVGADGKTSVFVDEAGVGFGEVLYRRRVRGVVYVAIDQTRDATSAVPQENISDSYRLTVTDEPLRPPGVETEPNSGAADANELTAGVAVTGHLEARVDVDTLRWAGPAGPVQITVQSDLAGLRWQVADGEWRSVGAAQMELRPGDLVRLQRSDGETPIHNVASSVTEWTVRVDAKDP